MKYASVPKKSVERKCKWAIWTILRKKNTIFALRIELLLLRRLLSDFHDIFEKICDFDAPQGYFPAVPYLYTMEKNEGFFYT